MTTETEHAFWQQAATGDKPWPDMDPSAPVPLYHQVFLAIREMINRGDLAKGTHLPSENALAQYMNVSRITVKRALSELADRKLVLRGRGRGTVVGEPDEKVVHGSFDGLTDSLTESGAATKIDLLDVTDLAATDPISARLGLERTAMVRRHKWRRRIEGRPFSFFTTYVALDTAEQFGAREQETLPFAVILQGAGRQHLLTMQWISAVAAEPEVAMVLAVDIGHPVLRVERLLHDEDGTPVQLLVGHYCSDEFNWFISSQGPFVGTVVERDHFFD